MKGLMWDKKMKPTQICKKKRDGKRCGNSYIQYTSFMTMCETCLALESKKPEFKKREWNKVKKEFHRNDLSKQKGILEDVINHIARLLDKGHGCISCGGMTTPQAGHYHSVGSHPSLRWHLMNIWTQDYSCNDQKSSNVHGYNAGITNIYGSAVREYMEFELPRMYPTLRPKIFQIHEWIEKSREVEKELVKADKVYTNRERLELRKTINERIGIYE